MDRRQQNLANHVRIGAGTLLLLGAGLILSGLALPYGVSGAAVSNAIIGALVMVLALVGLRSPLDASPVCWITAAFGIWVLSAPFVLGYGAKVLLTFNNIWLGVLVLLVSAFTAGEAMGLDQPLSAHE